ncbi:MAG TPA: dihydrolipoamide acetyltransferase family protein [Bacteroidales bacterium]|nr:dihydrolipoamide acetyltransferase family protein [Bacteroidales bacterium]
MAKMNILLPAMGEGVIEATISKWLVSEGSQVKEDDPIVEVATDKVDSEIPAPAAGTLVSIVAKEGAVHKIGDVLAVIENEAVQSKENEEKVNKEVERVRETIETVRQERAGVEVVSAEMKSRTPSGKFISPLVRSMANKEGINYDELDRMPGTGMDGRITKDDFLRYMDEKKSGKAGKEAEPQRQPVPETQPQRQPVPEAVPQRQPVPEAVPQKQPVPEAEPQRKPVPEVEPQKQQTPEVKPQKEDEVIPMDRVRRLISEHMVMSKRTSAHVTSFIDADVTRIVEWRNANKDKFYEREGQKLTLTPFFIDALAKAIYEIPMVNVQVDGTNIIKKKNINIGMAVALPDSNLIVPVIKNANEKSLTGLAKAVNDLASRARSNKLKPDEISGGTFTLTNYGSYDNLAGTPIINQPQAAILGTGAVKKTPVVIESPLGDMIGIRQIMIISLSYDHRVIDGALAGRFIQKVKNILENYTPDFS